MTELSRQSSTSVIARGFRAAALAPVFVYRKLVSPLIASRCRYYPSCSSYAVEAVREYGVFRGFTLAGWRLLRCNPFSDGGFDYVADQKLFRGRDHSADCDHKHKAVTVR